MPRPSNKSLLEDVRSEILELQAVERYLAKRFTHVNGNGVMKAAERALVAHLGTNGTGHEPAPHGKKAIGHWPSGRKKYASQLQNYKTKKKRRNGNRNPISAKPLPEIIAPDGLALSGVEMAEAIPLALKAYRRPASTTELTALLLAGGFKPKDGLRRSLAAVVGMMASKQATIKKTAKGWALRG